MPYRLVCAKLHTVPLEFPETPADLPVVTQKETTFWFLTRHTPLPAPPQALPWSAQSVWDCLVALLVDQLGLRPSEVQEVRYTARFAEDLGVD